MTEALLDERLSRLTARGEGAAADRRQTSGRCTPSRRSACAGSSSPTARPASAARPGTSATPRRTCRRRPRWPRPGTRRPVERLGRLLAAEARRKGVDVLLAPTVNLHRTPYGGRHFECLSEDPLLTGRLGAAYVRGLQSLGVGATVKHFVANDSETERFTYDATVDERTLRELYLAPFEAIVREGGVVGGDGRLQRRQRAHDDRVADAARDPPGGVGLRRRHDVRLVRRPLAGRRARPGSTC